MRVLLVEDNERLAALCAAGMERAGLGVDSVTTIADAEHAIAAVDYDLVLLDLGLPDGNGLDWLKKFRQSRDGTPILVVTARGATSDRVCGLNLGADDYIVKPFEMAELVARSRAILRRPGSPLGSVLAAANLRLDTVARSVSIDDRPVEASRRELALLELLLRRVGNVVPRDFLEDNLYNFDREVTPNALEAQVSRLRRRLSDAGARVDIHTVRGIGYLLREPAP